MDYWCSTHEIAKLAAEMELKGVEFYKHLQKLTTNPTISDMCGFFAEQEIEHHSNFLAIAEAHPMSECEQCYSVNICGMLKTAMHNLAQFFDRQDSTAPKLAVVSECLALAAQVEATAINVYTKMMEQCSDSFAGVLTEVLVEERKHLQIIKNIRKSINHPTS